METTPSTAAQLLVDSNVTDLLNSTNTVNFDDGPWFYAHISFMYVYEIVTFYKFVRFFSFAIGLPLNILVAYRLIRRSRKAHCFSRATLLKLHLNLSDTLVFIMFVLPRFVWTLTNQWSVNRWLSLIFETIHSGTVTTLSARSLCLAICLHFYCLRRHLFVSALIDCFK